MDQETYARKAEALRPKLYRTAYCYLGSEAMALDALDEAVYKGLRGAGKLRQPEYFETWLTRILLNECSRELKRSRRPDLLCREHLFCPGGPGQTDHHRSGLPGQGRGSGMGGSDHAGDRPAAL